jgi:hypothetical protein
MNRIFTLAVLFILFIAGMALVKGVSNRSFEEKNKDKAEAFDRTVAKIEQRKSEREKKKNEIDETAIAKEGLPPPAEATEYRILNYREAGVTQKFLGALEASLSGFIFEEQKPTKVSVAIFLAPGVPTILDGKPHLMVKSYSQMIHSQGNEITTSHVFIKGDSIVEIKNLDDKTVTKYEWLGIPETMKVGTEVKVGKVKEQDAAGKTLASGMVLFSLQMSGSNIEFCQIEILSEGPKPKERVERECRVFDRSGKVKKTGITVSIDGALRLVLEGDVKAGNISHPPYARN